MRLEQLQGMSTVKIVLEQMDWRMPLCSDVLPDAKLLKIKGEVP